MASDPKKLALLISSNLDKPKGAPPAADGPVIEEETETAPTDPTAIGKKVLAAINENDAEALGKLLTDL